MSLNVQYGCGLSAPNDWVNFDASPTLRLQKIPILGRFVTKVKFPSNIKFGDITKGLPGILPDSCDAIYCSHVLEHLSLEDFRLALRNTYGILKVGGIFRCVLPDLEASVNKYFNDKLINPSEASIELIRNTLLGLEHRPRSIKAKLISVFGNSHHFWMWDNAGLQNELTKVGFKKVRSCVFNDSANLSFRSVEDENRFHAAIAFECIK
jgi:predicted SAM-dependent methyltransferase